MAEDAPEIVAQPVAKRKRALGVRLARGVAFLIGGLATVAVALVFLLDTSVGHRFLIDRIAGLNLANGLKIEIGRIDGSIYGRSSLRDVRLSDPEGRFLELPRAELDWRPFAWLSNTLDIRELTITRGRLLRVPALIPSAEPGPLLPGFDIRIDRLEARDFVIEQGIAGDRRVAQIEGKADIRSGRALIDLDTDLQGADRLVAMIDAQPDENRLKLELDLNAPEDGVIAAMLGLDRPLSVRAKGRGNWDDWEGALLAQSADDRLAALKLYARSGRYRAVGQAYPAPFLDGLPARIAGAAVDVGVSGTMDEDRVFDGRFALRSAALQVSGMGAVDLGANDFDGLQLDARLLDPRLFDGVALENLVAQARLDGPLTDLLIDYSLAARQVDFGTVAIQRPSISGAAQYGSNGFRLPFEFTTAGATSPDPMVRRAFANLAGSGAVMLEGTRLTSDPIRIRGDGLRADVAVRGDTERGGYAVAGKAALDAFPIANIGVANVEGDLALTAGTRIPWAVNGNVAARMVRVDNTTLTTIAGTGIRLSSGINWGQGLPLRFTNARLNASKLALTAQGAMQTDGKIALTGQGTHTEYGPFTLGADIGADGPRATLNLESPYPALGLADVRIALAPIPDGFGIDAAGQSMLGPFDGEAQLFANSQQTLFRIARLQVSQTTVAGDLRLGGGGVAGDLTLTGGGLDGRVRLAPREGGQGVVANITASNARFAGSTPLSIAQGTLDLNALFAEGRSDVRATLEAQGIGSGNLFIGKVAANATLNNGAGRVNASIAGRRGSRFEMQMVADFNPNAITLRANGEYTGRRFSMPRAARLTKDGDVWRLARTQLSYGRGAAIAQGAFGGGVTDLKLEVSRMPLSLGDIAIRDLGLGGNASGVIEYRQEGRGVPTGTAKLRVDNLSRSGLLVTSTPIDAAINAVLSPDALAMRGVFKDGDDTIGRFQARIAGLPASGGLGERLAAGSLRSQIRYNGPADALWRLSGLELIDITGQVQVAADATGSIRRPNVRGTVSSRQARLESGLTGTVVENIAMLGRFAGSRLTIQQLTGKAPNGGDVSGSGYIDLAGPRGVALDLAIDARNAELLDRTDVGGTVTGKLTIRSDGLGGVIGSEGTLDITQGRFVLGATTVASNLPDIPYRERNARADQAPPIVRGEPWRYEIDARARNRIAVTGMGLDSEWSADIKLRGTTDAMRIGGEANFVRGGYQFAGRRFEIEQGEILFNNESPPNPRIDITAVSETQDIDAQIRITGTAFRPLIAFSSVPALPEEEVLARLLFGTSVTDISAPEAVQLAAALASLRSGGGLDPINQLRSAVGLDRLRIIGADEVTGQGTSVAAGKYITRRIYAEIVTDGRGYSATQVEFQIFRWLSILSSISTIGRESVNVRVQRDY